jgi:hypothetical protein
MHFGLRRNGGAPDAGASRAREYGKYLAAKKGTAGAMPLALIRGFRL